LPRLLLTGALLSPATLYALGLGEIRLHSALNQPFDAEIELISPTPEELAGLKVALASADLFTRYGIERPAYLSGFEFSISRSRDEAAIRVRSNRSVTEPFVTLLVEASWARGRLVREYTVLLDPPVFMPSEPQMSAPVSTPQAGAPSAGRIERPAPLETPAPEPELSAAAAGEEGLTPAPAAEESSIAQEEPLEPEQPAAPVQAPAEPVRGEYTVSRNDNLWKIVSRVNPGSPTTVNRTMIALFRANPAAFNGNINQLRAGSVLRIPEIAEIEAITAGDAYAEVSRQNAEWQGAAAPTQSVEDIDRLRLVTPDESPASPAGASQRLAEQASAERPPADAATPRPDDKRVAIPNPELAAAQQNVDETPVANPSAEPAPSQAQAAAPANTPAPGVHRTARRPPARPAAQGPSWGERIGQWFAQYWWAPVLFGVLLVLALVGVVVRRRRASAEEADALGSFSFDWEPRERRPVAFLEEEQAQEEEPFEQPAPTPTRRSEPLIASGVEETAGSPDQQDPLAEADFHMAYGLYDQAADLVKIAIEREPSRRDLKLKLLEIYFVWGNKDLFLEAARDLRESSAPASAGEWDKVAIMGKQIAPEESMFKGGASAGMDFLDVNLEGGEGRVDVDLFGEPQAEQSAAGLDLEFATGERKAAASSGSSLDFMLDEPPAGERNPTPTTARTQQTPTLESPMLDRASSSIRERVSYGRAGAEQTAELSIDDLGLDLDDIDHSGALEGTSSLENKLRGMSSPLRDDDRTQLAPSIAAQGFEAQQTFEDDLENTGTIYIDQVDLTNAHTDSQRLDLGVGEVPSGEDRESTNRQVTTEMELSELEPVTMSEVGTKLDLARAYMDMGDPEGARSILEEVLAEGDPGQKQEAQRLMESIR
jgi:pilus assembly protein FimV